jgi:hypothetical protein
MSHRIRMRMKCSAVTPSGSGQAVSLGTSNIDERVENVSFSDFKAGNPNSVLTIPVTAPAALGVFQVGKFYTLEIKPCET